jgi:hypothetical protein
MPRLSCVRDVRPAMFALFALGLAREGPGAQSPVPTFTRDVAPIFYRNCTSCHRPGGIGPMSLITYNDARASVDEIRDRVGTASMPPWHVKAPHGTFLNDRRLSDAEKQTILKWADGGAPMGDPAHLPAPPRFNSGWSIGTPDAVVSMPTDYEVPARGTIEYQYFEVPTNFTEDKWVQSIEILPGAREVVHHVLVFARAPAPATPAPPRAPGTPEPPPLVLRREDHRIPETPPGPDGKPRALGALIGTTAPGTNLLSFPAGTAMRVRAGSVLTFQMHYTAKGHAMKDRTSVGFVFAKEPPDEQVLATSFQNGQFTLRPGAPNDSVPAEVAFSESVKVWGLFPHTHLRGKRWEYRVVYPDGRAESILSVPEYDFNWQTYYMFAKPLAIPVGARIESMAWYDNSAANKSNPDPTKAVTWGDQSWEEMQYTGFLFTVDSRRRTRPAPR